MLRPARFGVCVDPGYPVVLLHALDELGLRPDVVVTLDPTETPPDAGPLRRFKSGAARWLGAAPIALARAPLRGMSSTWAFAHDRGWRTVDSSGVRDGRLAAKLRPLDLDYLLFAGFSLVGDDILRCARVAALGMRPSLLPRHRGALPTVLSALDGFHAAGFTISRMDAGIDTGAILVQEPVPAAPSDDARTQLEHAVLLGALRLARLTASLVAGAPLPEPRPQSSSEPMARRPTAESCRLQAGMSASEVDRRIRAGSCFGGALLNVDGVDIRVLAVLPEGPPVSTAVPLGARMVLVPLVTDTIDVLTLLAAPL